MNKVLVVGVVVVLIVIVGMWMSKSMQRQKEAAAKAIVDGQQFLKKKCSKGECGDNCFWTAI